jgi:hypothetical protein
MKRLLSLLSILLIFSVAGFPQQPRDGQKYFKRIFDLVRLDSVAELASLVHYPLKRPNPVPDIRSADEFIRYYPTLFDSAFRELLAHCDTSKIWGNWQGFTIFDGKMWIDDEGSIIEVHYSSPKEKVLRDSLTSAIQRKTHPSVNRWDENIYVLDAKRFLLRVDRTGTEVRYASWKKGKAFSDKPDLVLTNGTWKPQGSAGGITYFFRSGMWQYIVDDVYMCESYKPEKCGVFLELRFRGQTKFRIKCDVLK